jgi:hypothetical protein
MDKVLGWVREIGGVGHVTFAACSTAMPEAMQPLLQLGRHKHPGGGPAGCMHRLTNTCRFQKAAELADVGCGDVAGACPHAEHITTS